MNTATLLRQEEKERARQMVERFVRRFEESYRLLAYHAALPLVLTPELVNYLRVQFLRGDNVPWVAEVDLLLSDLCRQVGYELYAMDTAVRAYLLEQMEQEESLGKQRMQEVAKSLIGYVKYLAQTNPYISPQELQTQQWAAMVYLDTHREGAVSEIAQAFRNAAAQSTGIGQSLVNRAELARLARITQELTPQLRAYDNLVAYAELVAQVLTNPSQVEQEALRRSYPVSGVELSVPPELVPEGKLPESSLPPLQVFEFEAATVRVEGKRGLLREKEIVISRRQGQARFFAEDLGNGVTLEMVVILGGTFTMGAPENEEGSGKEERPQHQVTVQPFFMGKYPVTQAQWQAVAAQPQVNRELEPDPSRFKGADRPVDSVSWYDAVEFCARLSLHTGRPYRLPSEAEWEYACRAGTTTPFHFGETITTELANYHGTDDKDMNWKGSYGEGPKGEYREQTTPVGSFPANDFGLYDMHGNVWEWCADSWHSNYEGAPTDGSVWESDNNENDNDSRLLRGGSWAYLPGHCRSAYRFNAYPGVRHGIYFGFRVVCAAAWTVSEVSKNISSDKAYHYVLPHRRKDGTYVKGHYRRNSKNANSDAILIVESLIDDLAYKLLNEDDNVNGLVAITNAYGWELDEYKNLRASFKGKGKISFSVEMTLAGEQDDDRAFYGNSISAKVKGEVVDTNGNWQIKSYQVLKAELND